ncbi:polyprenyl synthetase family protein [Thermocatellispora tengchongensis]|uniref:polyprenyl synthetase family protein n=1 Tax=Thermocatellispora tengchongensis TaxID=1073253 RepID=UPI00363E0BD1
MSRSALEQLAPADDNLAGGLKEAMTSFEAHLREVAVDSSEPLIREAAVHLIDAGGKRWRPLLVFLGARFGDPDAPQVRTAAVSVELLHVASLYHDDVMDEAPMRHNVPSAHVRYGNKVAILVGDHLFARAASISIDLGDEARRAQSLAFERLVRGQVREAEGPRPGEGPADHYVSVVRDKSASLIALSVRLGGICSGADPGTIKALTAYGEALGVAFQLSDDLIDIMSEVDRSGKAAGTDLRAGLTTLPMLYAVGEGDAGARRLGEILRSGPVTDPALHAEALDLLRGSPAMDRAREEAERYAAEARAAVAALPDSPARDALDSLCDLAVRRAA